MALSMSSGRDIEQEISNSESDPTADNQWVNEMLQDRHQEGIPFADAQAGGPAVGTGCRADREGQHPH